MFVILIMVAILLLAVPFGVMHGAIRLFYHDETQIAHLLVFLSFMWIIIVFMAFFLPFVNNSKLLQHANTEITSLKQDIVRAHVHASENQQILKILSAHMLDRSTTWPNRRLSLTTSNDDDDIIPSSSSLSPILTPSSPRRRPSRHYHDEKNALLDTISVPPLPATNAVRRASHQKKEGKERGYPTKHDDDDDVYTVFKT